MRQIFLIACLISYVAMQTFWVLMGHWGFFWAFICIVIVILIWEVINVKKLHGKTLSTQTTQAIRDGANRVNAYLAVILMCLAIGFLALHLVWQ